MRILVTGASGLVGSALVRALENPNDSVSAVGGSEPAHRSAGLRPGAKGLVFQDTPGRRPALRFMGGQTHEVFKLVRSPAQSGERAIFWNPVAGELDAARLEGMDAVVHLAGDNIGGGRWTTAKKARIRDSRVQGTRLLCERLAQMERKPSVFVCASAVGIYGDRGNETLTEESAPGAGFLAEVCRAWEAAAEPARQAGIRTVHLRFGVILSATGGALAKMLPVFRLGLGGVIGSGEQYWSWIALEDAVGVIGHVVANESLSGPVNVVAPEAVTNREFTKALGRALRRPTVFPLPAVIAKLALGEMAEAALLASARVEPAKLKAGGYVFHHPVLRTALKNLLADACSDEAA